MEYTTEIENGKSEEGDVLCFPQDSHECLPFYDIICKIENGKVIEIPSMEEIVPNEKWRCIRIDYKFISDGTWYVEGSEAYPTHHVSDGEEYSWGAFFKGWTNEGHIGFKGELPRWDGECCSLDEFKIEKR